MRINQVVRVRECAGRTFAGKTGVVTEVLKRGEYFARVEAVLVLIELPGCLQKPNQKSQEILFKGFELEEVTDGPSARPSTQRRLRSWCDRADTQETRALVKRIIAIEDLLEVGYSLPLHDRLDSLIDQLHKLGGVK